MTVAFQNKGLIELGGITTFGVCAKVIDDPIGYFGTGLKYAIAVMLREGLEVQLHRGTTKYTFEARKRKFRNQVVNQVFMNDMALPYTTELGKNWELWMAYRELAANAYDEDEGFVDYTGDFRGKPLARCTTFMVKGEAFDNIHAAHNTIFLRSDQPKHTLEGLEIHDNLDAGGWIYYRGIRVYKLSKQSLYTYNITADLKLTEDRTISSIGEVFRVMSAAIATCDDAALIRQLLVADQRYWESTIDYHWWHYTPGETFYKVVSRLHDSRTSFSSSAYSMYGQFHPADQPPDTIQIETIPIEQRRRLWAALHFWDRLGIPIPKAIVHITNDMGTKKTKSLGGQIYISKFVLEMDMRHLTGLLYKAYAETRPKIGDIKQEDLLIDTIVDFGEQLLGVSKRKVA